MASSRSQLLSTAVAALTLLASCATTTQIAGTTLSPDAATTPAALQPFIDEAVRVSPDNNSTPAPNASPERATNIPEGWTSVEARSYRLGVPGDWIGVTNSRNIAAVLTEVNGFEPGTFEIRQYEDFLSFGDSVIALGAGGDNVNAFKQLGPVSTIADPDQVARQLSSELRGWTDNVSVSAEAKLFGGLPGVFTVGSYDWAGTSFDIYQFATHRGIHVYFFTLTLLTGQDPELAEQILATIELG